MIACCINNERIEELLDFEVIEGGLTKEEEAKVTASVKTALQMSSLTLDLFLWNQLEVETEQFAAFQSILEESPHGSHAHKLSNDQLIIEKIKAFMPSARFTYPSGIKQSKRSLEEQINIRIDELGDDIDCLYRLLDPEPFNFTSRELRGRWGSLPYDRWEYQRWLAPFFADLKVRYQWRIIQRLPRAQEFLRKKIPSVEYEEEIFIDSPPSSSTSSEMSD